MRNIADKLFYVFGDFLQSYDFILISFNSFVGNPIPHFQNLVNCVIDVSFKFLSAGADVHVRALYKFSHNFSLFFEFNFYHF